MRFTTCFCSVLAVILSPFVSGQSPAGRAYFSDPGLSPTASEIAFVSGGDIWTVPAGGGEARLLVSNPATESRPLYAPDGKSLAFNSSRTGNGDVYLLHFETGSLSRVTFDDGNDELSGWSKDGRYLYFSSTSKDISGMRDIFRVKATGGTPMAVADNRYINEFHGAASPDGKSIAFAARGFGSHQWWRNGRSHLDESEIWLRKEGITTPYAQLTERGARQLWPMWSKDGKTLYYVSDRSGKENIWEHPLDGTPRSITKFNSGRVLWPSIAADGGSIVFERDFAVWKLDVATGTPTKVEITLRGSAAAPPVERARLTNGFSDLALSPDGKKVAFLAHGEVFVTAAKEGGEATRVTNTAGEESWPTWSANSNILYYVSGKGGADKIYAYDFLTAKETKLTDGPGDDAAPLLSPRGTSLAYVRDGSQLRTYDLSSKKDMLLTRGYLGRPPFQSPRSVAWSPDGNWLAFAGFGAKSLRNIYVIPSNGGAAKPVSFLANAFGSSVQWTKDGRSILFTTGQRTENGYVARVDLVPQQPRFREDQFRDLFVEPSPTAPANTTPVTPKKESPIDSIVAKSATPKNAVGSQILWEGLQHRISLLPLGTDIGDMLLSKDGNTLFVLAAAAGQSNVYAYSLDELSRDAGVLRQLTFTGAGKSDLQATADGKELFYLESGRIQSVSVENKTSKALAVTAEMEIDFSKEKMAVFAGAWDVQNKGFYDSAFHGRDWGAVKEQYAPYAAGAKTPDELRRLLNLMVGELNASHSGVGGPQGASLLTGRTGLRFDRATYENEGKFRITEVVALSPASIAGGIAVGSYLMAIDGKELTAGDNVDGLLEGKVNRRVVLRIGTGANTIAGRDVTIRPVNAPTEKGLLYKQWVAEQREYVKKASNGRLGYVHMFDMGQGSLDQLYLDMDAENHSREGVVVDVRNNNGGFVNAYALDVLSRRGYMTMTVRGLPPAPARMQLGQRALDAPTILITNQHSLSDAEDFSEGYRTLGLGKVVGEPTAGWIIYTSSAQLVDGSTIRLPFIKITDNRGKNMELAPREVDIPVTNPLGEKERDRQLDAAVNALLKQIGEGRK